LRSQFKNQEKELEAQKEEFAKKQAAEAEKTLAKAQDEISQLKTEKEKMEKDGKEQLEKALQKLQGQHDEEIEKLNRKLKDVKESEEITVNSRVEEKTKEKLELFEKEKKLANDKLDLANKNEAVALERERLTAEHKDEVIKRLEKDKDFLQGQIVEQNKPKKSAEIGKIGEEQIEGILSEGTDFRVENVTKQKHKGDFASTFPWSHTCCMLEVKNQEDSNQETEQEKPKTKTVQKRELDKFLKDLDDNEEYHCGLIVSLETGFTQQYNDYEFHRTPKGKLFRLIGRLNKNEDPGSKLTNTLAALQIAADVIRESDPDK